MSVISNNILAGASGQGGSGYEISRSLRFNSPDSSFLSRTPSSVGNRRTWTWSGWVKRSSLAASDQYVFGAQGSGSFFLLGFLSTHEFFINPTAGVTGATLKSNAQYRDPSAWYHIVVAVDTTQSTASDRVRVYINGDEITSWATSTYPSQDTEWYVNDNAAHRIGSSTQSTGYCNVYLADIHLIDGQALAPTDFGEFDINNTWQPKEFTGSYGWFDKSQAWSSSTFFNNNGHGYYAGSAANIFDNVESGPGSQGDFALPVNGGTFTLTFTQFSSAQTVELEVEGTGNALKINGSFVTIPSGSPATATYNVSGLTTIEWLYNGGSNYCYLGSIKVDGKKLIDSSVSVADNSFYLDFSDNSSKAALGKNSAFTDDFTSTVGALTTSQAADFYTAGSNPANNLFDGSTSTIVYGGYNSTSTNSDLIWTPNGAYTASSSLRVYAGYYSAIYVNGVSKATGGQSSAPAWVTLNHTGSITSIKFENTSNANTVRAAAIEVDGTILETTAWTVNNLQAAGSAWDQSQTWSSLGTGTAYNSNYVWANAFDGDKTVNSPTTFPGGGQTMTWTPSSPITVNNSVIVYVYNQTNGSSYGIKVNGSYLSPATNAYATPIVRTAAQLNNQLTSIELVTDSSYHGPYLAAVEVDGVLLVDSGVVDTAASNIDSLIDTPTNYEANSGNNGGNYCTLNPLNNSGQTLKEGNLECSGTSGRAVGTLFASSGKFYWEFTAGSSYTMAGIESSTAPYGATYSGENNQQYALYGNAGSGQIYHNGGTSSFDGFVSGDIIGVALDMDAGNLYFYKNGSAMNSGAAAATGLTGAWTANCRSGSGAYDGDTIFNFGQRPFQYPPGGTGGPSSDYKSLCTQNLADPTIADGSTAMDVALYTGNSSTQTISGLEFSPDLVWLKARNAAYFHRIYDTVRGATKELYPDDAAAENTTSDGLTSFDSNGFTLGANAGINESTKTYVGWAWDAGSSNTSISVGGMNSSVYNQSQVWSTYGTFTGTYSGSYDWSGVFAASNTYDAAGSLYLTSGTGKWTLTSPLACNAEIKIYVNGASSFTINEGLSDETTVASTSSGFHYVVIPFSGNISSIKLNTATQYTIRIYVDGAALIDQGITLGGTGVPNVPTIASTVRANPSTGVSIINYVGTGSAGNIWHGLNHAPALFMIKNRALTNYDWWTWHEGIGPNYYVRLNSSNARAYAGHFFAEAPDSSVIKLESGVGITSTNHDHIVYAFAPVENFSAFGKFSGNSNTDGPFQYCGFKPRFLLLKGITQARDWIILDTERDAGNVGDSYLHPNTNGAESTYAIADILSNGFKMRYNGGLANQTGEDYIWAAFASHPFKNSRAR